MPYAITKELKMVEIDCIVCGVIFAIPHELHEHHRRVGGFHHCPNGHSQGWEKGQEHTKIKELERELAAEGQRKRDALARENQERLRADKAEREVKRQRNRAKAGVCPCCKRTFVQLARHMATKHPEAK